MNSGSERQLPNERLWHYVRAINAVMVGLFVSSSLGLNYYIVRTSPRTPDVATGHIYATNIHGIVYLTLLECRLRSIPWMIFFATVVFVVVAKLLLGEEPRPRES